MKLLKVIFFSLILVLVTTFAVSSTSHPTFAQESSETDNAPSESTESTNNGSNNGAGSQEQDEISVESQEIAYDLPYAGILPDHPLYFMKRMRDSMWVFLTRDNLEKADILLLLYDKKIVMARELADKGKWDVALDTVEESQENFQRMIEAYELATKIGSSPSQDVVNNALLSNDKHLEVLEDLLKKSPQGVRMRIEDLMKQSVELHNQLNAI